MIIDAEIFQSHRPLLFSIAYRMLGSASEAEDVVQDAYLRQATANDEVRSPAAYLSTIVSRLCLDRLKAARAQREEYIGPWLPEPILTNSAEDAVEQRESISTSLLLLLEHLNPVERAAFLLHNVFEYSYQEIADMLDTSMANCRQLVHRAKQRINTQPARYTATPEQQHRLLERFLAAAQQGDLPSLVTLLEHDVTCWTDSGGKVSAARRPVTGAQHVAQLLLGILRKGTQIAQAAPGEAHLVTTHINGMPGILFVVRGVPDSVATFATNGQCITGIQVVRNPEKLRYIQRQYAQHT